MDSQLSGHLLESELPLVSQHRDGPPIRVLGRFYRATAESHPPVFFGKIGRDAEAWAKQFVSQRTAPLDAGQSMADVASRLVPQMIGPGSLPEGLKLAEHCMASVPAATYRRALDCLVTFDRQADLAGIGVPTLLIGGEFDRVAAPAVMKQMAATIPQARYAELPGIGHLMNLEAPEAFDGLLLDFLNQPAPDRARETH